MKLILDVIKASVFEKLTVSDVAKRLGRSESWVKKSFDKRFGDGIIHYHTKLKINESNKLLRETDLQINEISDRLAFDTPQYFAKCFKRYTGMTPREYRSSIFNG